MFIYCRLQADYKASMVDYKTAKKRLEVLKSYPGKVKIEDLEDARCRFELSEKLLKIHKKEFQKLKAILTSLSREFDEKELQIFQLRYIKGCSLQKIAKITAYSESRIKQIHKSITKKLPDKPKKDYT